LWSSNTSLFVAATSGSDSFSKATKTKGDYVAEVVDGKVVRVEKGSGFVGVGEMRDGVFGVKGDGSLIQLWSDEGTGVLASTKEAPTKSTKVATKEAEPTAEPTKEPEATKEAEPTKEAEATKEAEPTKKPEATETKQTEAPTETPYKPIDELDDLDTPIQWGDVGYYTDRAKEHSGKMVPIPKRFSTNNVDNFRGIRSHCRTVYVSSNPHVQCDAHERHINDTIGRR
jgi:hypothetical protein